MRKRMAGFALVLTMVAVAAAIAQAPFIGVYFDPGLSVESNWCRSSD